MTIDRWDEMLTYPRGRFIERQFSERKPGRSCTMRDCTMGYSTGKVAMKASEDPGKLTGLRKRGCRSLELYAFGGMEQKYSGRWSGGKRTGLQTLDTGKGRLFGPIPRPVQSHALRPG